MSLGPQRIAPRPHIADMAAYASAKLSVPHGKRLISLSQNESSFAPSPHALDAAKAALAQSTLYSDPNYPALRNAIAETHGLDPERVLCANGSMTLIAALIAAFAGPKDHVLSTKHAYAYFKTATQMAGATYKAVPEIGRIVSIDEILDAATPATRVVCVANPGNPTGTRIPGSELRRLRDGLPASALLLIDEAYAEFAPHDPVFDLVDRGDTCITRTFSKAYALAGLRVGWGVFTAKTATHISKIIAPGSIAGPSIAAAEAAMRDQAHMRSIVSQTIALRDSFIQSMNLIDLHTAPSHTNFALIDFGSVGQAKSADQRLRTSGIVLRPMDGYGIPHCLRATISAQDDMETVVRVLTAWRET